MSESTNPIPYEGKENYIFVSYSHMDMDRVMPVVRQWMENGYRVWYDDGISPGTVIGIPRQRWNTNNVRLTYRIYSAN